MSQNARIGKSSPMVSQVNVARISLRSQTIADWQNAINSARNETFPRRKQLYELYDNLKLDAHLAAVQGKRTTNVTNKRIVWVQEGASEKLMERIREDILEAPWFYEFITNSMEVVPYGTTLLELVVEQGLVSRCEVFPRANVVPEFGHITLDATNPMQADLMYRTDPYWSTFLVEVGKPKDLGAMVIALPYILYKRGSLGDWAQFAELFGMPFRVGKYNQFDESTRTKLLTALSEMGGAGYTVIPDGTSLEFIQASSGSGQSTTYKDLLEFCNGELSKLFLGNTMTTEQGDRGARSLGEVHMSVEEDIALSDMRRVEFLLNWELKDRLEKLGYPVGKGHFAFDRTLNLPMSERIKVDVLVAQQLGGLPPSYWRETYNIPEPTPEELKEMQEKHVAASEAAQAAAEKAAKATDPEAKEEVEEEEEETEPEEKAKPAEKKKSSSGMNAALNTLYEPTHTHGFTAAKGKTFEGSDVIMDEIAKAMHDGRITEGYIDPKLMQWTADQLTEGLFEGFEIDDEAPAQSKQLQDIMRKNVHVFSGFKTYQTLQAATAELLDEDGQFRSFGEFKKRILAIDKEYNVNYLRSEYNLAVARGMAAEKWMEVQADKELFPILRWSTAGDDRVRPEHDALDGVEKPVDDEFWKTHWIPLSWGCRCDIEQLRRPSGNGKDLPREQWPVASPMFTGNVGIDGNIFPKGHPYYAVESKAAKRVNAEVDALAEKMLLPTTATKPSGPPVSGAVLNKAKGTVKDAVNEALSMIDAAHGDGKLAPMPIYSGKLDEGIYGRYLPDWRAGTAIDITIAKSKHTVNSVLHEAGHWLDHVALGNGKWVTEKQTKEVKDLFKAMNRTKAVKNLQAILKTGYVQDKEGKNVALFYNQMERIDNYLLHPRELWARAYNQYIVTKNGRQDLQDLLKKWDDDLTFMGVIREQWTPEDFAPLVPKFDAIFKQQGWQTK